MPVLPLARRALALSFLLAACSQAAARKPAEAGGPSALDPLPEVVASWTGGQITAAELRDKTAAEEASLLKDFRTERYDLRTRTLDELIADKLLEAEAARKGLPSVDALLEAELPGRVVEPSEERIQAAFRQIQRDLPTVSLDEARPYILRQLGQDGMRDAFFAYLGELRTAASVATSLPYPELPRTEIAIGKDDLSVGPAGAKVTVVEFAEYPCPYCGMAASTVKELLAAYEGKVRFVWKDFPLPSHERAVPAAVAARCAAKQGKWESYHEALWADQRALADADLTRRAESLGLDLEAFAACQADPAVAALVAAKAAEGQALGVNSTPTFFINGIELAGALPLERFKAIVDAELAR